MRAVTLILVVLLLLLQYPLWIGKGSWLKVWELNRQLETQQEINRQNQVRNALLDAEVIQVLDEFEGYSAARQRESLYLREAITLIAPSGVEAWVYTYNEVPDASMRIISGDWRAHLSERANE